MSVNGRGTAGSSVGIKEWGWNGMVNRAVGAGFPRPDWSNRRNRRANWARRAVLELESDAGIGEWGWSVRTVQEQKSGVGIEERSMNGRVNRG